MPSHPAPTASAQSGSGSAHYSGASAPSAPRTVRQAIVDATAQLVVAGIESPVVDARLIASHALGVDSSRLFFSLDDDVPPSFDALVARRATREPLQHITGRASFGPLDLVVGAGVFIPRPETEVLAEWAVKHVHERAQSGTPVVVDLCTGSGALACYIAHECPQARVFAVEKSPDAARYARRNAESLAANMAEHLAENLRDSVPQRADHVHVPHYSHPFVTVIETDATSLQQLAGTELGTYLGSVDVVVTNPPYVPEKSPVGREVTYDPHEAVFGGEDGLEVIRPLVDTLAALLKPGGVCGIEHDDDASSQVTGLLRRHGGFESVASLRDLNGVERHAIARRTATPPPVSDAGGLG